VTWTVLIGLTFISINCMLFLSYLQKYSALITVVYTPKYFPVMVTVDYLSFGTQFQLLCLQCFDTVSWASGRACGL